MSGFEGNSTLSAIPSSATGDNYQHFSGSDNTTGYTWPMNFWGASSTVTGIHAIVGGTNNVSTYINNYIDTLTGPTGSSTHALRLYMNGPAPGFCCIQSTFQISGMSQQVTDVYIRYWTKFNPEFASQIQSNSLWRTLFELKTFTDYRIPVYVYASGGVPWWHVHADNNPNNTCPPTGTCTTFWSVDNHNVPVPLTDWFYVEYYLHRSTGSDGRFFFAVNGQTVADHYGPTYGVNQENINFLAFLNLYGNVVNPAYQWIDNIEVWDLPPCATLPCGAGTNAAPDTQAPTAPANLSASAVSSSQINLSWTASTDNVGVAGYRIFRNGGATPIASVTSTSFQDTGLTASTTYTYTVAAYDAAGNTSPLSNVASATTPIAPPDIVLGMAPTSSTTLYSPSFITDGDLTVTNYAGAGTGPQWIQLDLGQTYAINGINVWHYFGDNRTYHCVIIQISGVADFSSGTTTVFNNDQANSCGQGAGTDAEYAEASTGKQLKFNPVNGRYVRLWTNGNTVNAYNHYTEVQVYGNVNSGGDTTPPSTPTGLAAVAMSSSQINLSWNASSDNVGVAGYRIYRNGGTTPIATVSSNSYRDTGLASSTTYTYTVTAYDAAGNVSGQSAAASATTFRRRK